MLELALNGEIRVDDARSALRAAQQLRKTMVVLRTDDEIDRRLPAGDFRSFGLGDAAGDDDRGADAA